MTITTPAPSKLSQLSLMPHQAMTRDFLNDNPYAAIWLDVGFGKTLAALSSLMYTRPSRHILVVAPVAIARSTWIDEIEDWGFPIRTKSLIVNGNDKQLSKDKRLKRFQEVFTDPPTMYFINQELLTQPAQPERLLTPVSPASPSGSSPGVSQQAMDLLATLQGTGPITREELITFVREQAVATGEKPPAKSHLTDGIKELLRAELVMRESHDCRGCGGQGCSKCMFGLIDQMPTRNVDGRTVIEWPFGTIIIDESQGFRSHSSQRFKALSRVRPAVDRVIELTGTPTPNGLHDLWSQMYLLDQGKALGPNITTFRNTWFTPQMVPGTNTPAKWIPNPGAAEQIYSAIEHMVISAHSAGVGLTEPIVDDVKVSLPPDLRQAYKDFQRELVLNVVTENLTDQQKADGVSQQAVAQIVADNAAVLTNKLLQFANGALYTEDPDEGPTTGKYTVIHDLKIELAEYLVRNTGGEPVLIAYSFASDKKRLLAHFAAAGIDARAFDGSRAMIHAWNRKEIPVMLLHPAAAGHGINLQHGGRHLIWFGLTYNLEHYIQTMGRLNRKGQTQQVIVHRLLTRGTRDMKLPGVLETKRQQQDQLLDSVDGEKRLMAAFQEEVMEDLNDLWASTRL